MMAEMPRPRPQYLLRERTRHGLTVWYVRKGDGPRIRIHGKYGSPEFMAEYLSAVAGKSATAPIVTVPADDPSSLAWLVGLYRKSSDWGELADATRKARDNILHNTLMTSGGMPYLALTRKHIYAGRERRKDTPAAANAWLKAMRGLFKWAGEADLVKENPTAGVTALALKSDGFHMWTDDEVSKFEARWLVGTRERLALDLLLYTGLRRGDAVRLGRQHVRKGVFTIKTEKGGVEVVAPILPQLAWSIKAAPTGDLSFIAGVGGKPMVKESFGNWFREACNAAGVPGAAHGLRKAGASRAAENGATNEQLKAIFGWTDDKMPSLYTKAANRAKMAKAAMSKLERRPDEDEENENGEGGD